MVELIKSFVYTKIKSVAARTLLCLLGAKGKDIERTDSPETPPLKTNNRDACIAHGEIAKPRLR